MVQMTMQKSKGGSIVQIRKTESKAPRRLIIVVAGFLCLGLLGSALFTFATLSRLRTEYLSNRAHEISTVIDAQVRGAGRRNNPAFWQSVFENNIETYTDSVAFLALRDQRNNLLASVGKLPAGPRPAAGTTVDGVYCFEEMLPRPRRSHVEGEPTTTGWSICVGLYSTGADFIQRLAFLQLVVSALAIVALAILSMYLVSMLNRFLEIKAREAAEAQLKSLGIMAASLAHEIRNPLGAMKGLTQLAQEELPPDHTAQTQLQTVVNEAGRLEKLVADLLDFARAKELQIREFNLADLLSDIGTMLQSRLDASEISLQLSIHPNPFPIQTDPSGLRQVLLNVLMNAIDATPPQGSIVVNVAQTEDHRSSIIQIDDSGAGLGSKTSDELFQPFVTTKVRGTGLGLAVSKQIIESLGGSLHLESLPPGGARCSIRIPIRP
jgi:signal transduction histidine kinase